MNKIFDVKKLALFYLFLPIALFLWNWFELYYAVPLIALIGYCVCSFSAAETSRLSRGTIAVLVAIVAVWVLLSGLGGYMFQNSDHLYRNAVLRDLVAYEWPVVYHEDNQPIMLCYYLTYWLPAALVGKLTNLDVAQTMLYLWSVLGMLLVVRLSCNMQPRYAVLLACYLVFCGGADLIPYTATHMETIKPWSHIEWYCPWQYSSITTCLFWVFNQAVPAWICTLLVLDEELTLPQKVFISGMMYCYAPFPFIGVVMYVALDYAIGAYYKYRQTGNVKGWLKEEVVALFAWRSQPYLLCGLAIVLLSSTYFGCTGCGVPIYFLKNFSIVKYLAFCGTEFLIPVCIMLMYRYQLRRVIACGIILLFLPIIQVISFTDYVMRVSIPTLFILFLTFFSFVIERRSNRKLAALCVCYMVVCAATSGTEILRSIGKSYTGNTTPQYVESVTQSPNFASRHFMKTPYYRYFMKGGNLVEE